MYHFNRVITAYFAADKRSSCCCYCVALGRRVYVTSVHKIVITSCMTISVCPAVMLRTSGAQVLRWCGPHPTVTKPSNERAWHSTCARKRSMHVSKASTIY
jgi:hypothetical protein